MIFVNDVVDLETPLLLLNMDFQNSSSVPVDEAKNR